jgi:competence protein ComFC
MPHLIKLKEMLLDALFPPICVSCESFLNSEEKDNAICHLCFSKISIHSTLFCGVCKARLPENKKICHKNAKYLLGAVTNYGDIVRNLIHQYKYGRWQRVALPLNDLAAKYLQNLNLKTNKSYIVIPIPIHENKKAERGFNQSEIIAEHVAEKLNLPLINDNLIRQKETKSQTEFQDWGQRRDNLK